MTTEEEVDLGSPLAWTGGRRNRNRPEILAAPLPPLLLLLLLGILRPTTFSMVAWRFRIPGGGRRGTRPRRRGEIW